MKKISVKTIVISALLCSIGIAIPLIMPFKIVIEPASFTLASHVAIFVAMFISPFVACFVALGTAAGFFLAGFPVVIGFRALSHVVFALIGAYILKNNPNIINSTAKLFGFAVFIALIHSVCETLVVAQFYFGGALSKANYVGGFVKSVMIMIGVGTIVHSLVDFAIAVVVWKSVRKLV